MEENPSQQVVLQRVRNRIIEYLETAASFERQRAYQAAVPFVPVPVEIVCMYEDFVPSPGCLAEWGPPVFSPTELAALRQYSKVLDDVCKRTPDPLPPLEQAVLLPEWEVLRHEAAVALEVFLQRGKLPEERACE